VHARRVRCEGRVAAAKVPRIADKHYSGAIFRYDAVNAIGGTFMRAMVCLGLMALCLGCGGAGGTSSFSCVTGQNNCYDLSLSGGDLTQAENDCTQNKGGTIGTSCTHASAVGGCKSTQSAYGGALTVISWSYSGDATALMSECSSLHGTWVTP
jgi:hypothetical protein